VAAASTFDFDARCANLTGMDRATGSGILRLSYSRSTEPTAFCGRFETFTSSRPHANVRQMLGRPGEIWAAESGTD
jgi:hypothetical protein